MKQNILQKCLEWQKLTEELSILVGVSDDQLPRSIRVILQIASEGQQRGFRAAATAPKPKKSEMSDEPENEDLDTPWRRRASRAKKPLFADRIAMALGTDTLTLSELMERLVKRKWIREDSKQTRVTVVSTLGSKSKSQFIRVSTGTYKLRDSSYAEKLTSWYGITLKGGESKVKAPPKGKATETLITSEALN